jgi:indolepyruvate decarboxylase
MYPAAELNIAGRKGFMCNAVWQSIGYSVGAAVGVGLAQARRPLVVCGDGGFQMTAQSLSTMVQQKIKAVVIVLDNGHYGIEQWLLDPDFFDGTSTPLKPYLALNRWNYVDLAKAFGFTSAKAVATAADLQQALTDARGATGPVLINATIKRRDLPSVLRTS